MKKHWWNSLRVKIIAWSFVPTAIILSTVAWFTFYSYQKVLVDQAIKQDRDTVQYNAVETGRAMGRLIDPVMVPVFLDVHYFNEDPLEVRAQNILDRAKDLEVFDGGIYILDQQGKVYITWPAQPELYDQDWSDTPEFRYVLDHTNTYALTDLKSNGSNGKEIICAAIAMTGPQGEFVGAGYYCFTVSPAVQNAYYKTLNDLNLGPGVYIVDGKQRVIYSPVPSEISKDLSEEAYLQQLLQGQSTSGRFHKGTEAMVISYFPVNFVVSDQLRWILIKEQSWAEIMQPTLAYRQLLLVLLALGVIVPVLVTAYGVRHITNPIQNLIRASEQVTAGQFKHRIEVKTGDEIETLADQFNLMSAELDDSYSSLEKKVADRTRELAIMNSILSVASRSLDIEEILEDALNQTVEQMGFDAGVAFKFEPPPTPPLLMAHQGFEPATAVDLVNSYAIAGRGIPAGYPEEVITFDIQDFPGGKLGNQLSQFDFQLLVYIPLSAKERKLGFFILGKHEARQLSPEELSLLSSIGKQVGVAMENARLYEQAEHAATTAERNRLARELHDAVTQTLFSASLIADVIPRIWRRDPEEGLRSLEELRRLTRGALAEMRTLLLEMRPESLERSDIKSLLTQLADAFVGRVRVPVSLDIRGDCELTHEVKLVFYRVAQEALNNIAKHSGARQVDVHLECQPGQLGLCIKDDGLGFDPGSITPDHLGIAIMRERANSIGARLKVESQVGQGTTVELDWRSAREG
jgi:nitrate/nitrite-specific signal transduction histidine kinase